MTHWAWFAIFGLGVVAYFLADIGHKLQRVIRLLEIATDQQSEIKASLLSIEHDADVIRANTSR